MLKPKLVGGQLKAYTNDAATFAWAGGLPLPSSPLQGVKSGVYSVAGVFSMTISAATAAEVAVTGSTRQLTLYLGAYNCDGRLTVSAPNKKEASQIVTKESNAIHFAVEITWLAASEVCHRRPPHALVTPSPPPSPIYTKVITNPSTFHDLFIASSQLPFTT